MNVSRMNETKAVFRGPLFVTGMPRSGTKLLRDLLNNHPNISIPIHESHLIPMFLEQFGKDADLRDETTLRSVLEAYQKTKFYHCYPEKKTAFSLEKIQAAQANQSWAHFFRYILKLYAAATEGDFFIWGDKTPGYNLHFELLENIFPNIKFIHIVRDPRDTALSVHHAWGKSMLRDAQRWAKTMTNVQKYDAKESNFRTVLYEDLLENPSKVLSNLCTFIALPYHQGMHQLSRQTENLGETQGSLEVVAHNKNKFLDRIPTKTLRRIEEIVCLPATHLGYQMVHKVEPKSLEKGELLRLKIYDGIQSVRYHIREKGFRKGVWYFWKLNRESSWNQ